MAQALEQSWYRAEARDHDHEDGEQGEQYPETLHV
jgi:hypothetical protein